MKQIFFFIHILLLTLTAYQGVKIMYKGIETPALNKSGDLSDNIHLISGQTEKQDKRSHKKRNQRISTRNIFKVLTQGSSMPGFLQPDNSEKKLKKTELKIALWGTVTGGPPADSYAVIEDKKENRQSLFQVGDVVQQATIKKIMRSKIILTVNGKDQILEVDDSQKPSRMVVGKNLFPEQKQLFEAATNIPLKTDPLSLMKQVKIRPYFKNGKPNGLLLYGIKPGSAFQSLGLKNGDIVREINGTQTLAAKDAMMIYQDMESISDMRFVVRRRGQEKEIIYSAENNSYTEQTVPNE